MDLIETIQWSSDSKAICINKGEHNRIVQIRIVNHTILITVELASDTYWMHICVNSPKMHYHIRHMVHSVIFKNFDQEIQSLFLLHVGLIKSCKTGVTQGVPSYAVT